MIQLVNKSQTPSTSLHFSLRCPFKCKSALKNKTVQGANVFAARTKEQPKKVADTRRQTDANLFVMLMQDLGNVVL